MNPRTAAVIGGLAAGLGMTLIMHGVRAAGSPHPTLGERAEDWMDELADTRRHLGDTGNAVLEHANHFAASAGFGYGYGLLREAAPSVPPLVLGAAYGAALYLVNIVGIAPLIGLTEGEGEAPAAVNARRAGLHIFYGLATALVVEAAADRP